MDGLWSRRLVVLTAILGVLMAFGGALSWLPAAAEDAGTPAASVPTAEATEIPTPDTGAGQEAARTGSIASLAPEVIQITSVVASCGTVDTEAVVTVTIGNPQDGVAIMVGLMNATGTHGNVWIALNASQSDYSRALQIPPDTRFNSDEITVSVIGAMLHPSTDPWTTSPSLPIESNDVPVFWQDDIPNSVTVCRSGVTPTATLETPTATPVTPTATLETPTATPETPTATPHTPTATPVTPTPSPKTPTATPVNPTATAIPETPTPTPAGPTMELTTHTASCQDGSTRVRGSLTILNAEYGARVDFAIMDGAEVVSTESIVLVNNQQVFPYEVGLPGPLSVQAQSFEVVISSASGDSSPAPLIVGMPVTEGPFPVRSSGGVTVCGDAGTTTPTETATPPPTETPTPEPTATPVAGDVVEALIALLITILTSILAGGT